MSFLGRAWDRWQIINKVNGDFIAKVAIGCFYYTVCAAFAFAGLVMSRLRPTTDPLNRKAPATWLYRSSVDSNLDAAHQQF